LIFFRLTTTLAFFKSHFAETYGGVESKRKLPLHIHQETSWCVFRLFSFHSPLLRSIAALLRLTIKNTKSELPIQSYSQGQHSSLAFSLLSCCLYALVCITSMRDIRAEFGAIPLVLECLSAAFMASMADPWFAHGQHFCNRAVLSNVEVASHFGFSHANWHLGFGQRVGVLHFQAHLVFSQSGVQFGSGAVQVVRQTAGRHTVSHDGQFFDSHISFGHRTEQTGSSQRTSHAAQPVGSQFIWHFGRAQTG